MKKALLTFVFLGLFAFGALENANAKRKNVITTSFGKLLMLIDLHHSTKDQSKVYIDDESCQCVCVDAEWTCVDTEECHLQDEVCIDEELSFDDEDFKTVT